jgi:hypothetical protein
MCVWLWTHSGQKSEMRQVAVILRHCVRFAWSDWGKSSKNKDNRLHYRKWICIRIVTAEIAALYGSTPWKKEAGESKCLPLELSRLPTLTSRTSNLVHDMGEFFFRVVIYTWHHNTCTSWNMYWILANRVYLITACGHSSNSQQPLVTEVQYHYWPWDSSKGVSPRHVRTPGNLTSSRNETCQKLLNTITTYYCFTKFFD